MIAHPARRDDFPNSPAAMSAAPAFSALDSERFGVRIARANPGLQSDAADCARWCRGHAIDMLIARCAVDALSTAKALTDGSAYLTDTLLIFRAKSAESAGAGSAGAGEVLIRPAHVSDAPAVAAIAAACFANYGGHYHADARLDRQACDALYVDWATRSVQNKAAADVVLLAESSAGEVVGFTTLRARTSASIDVGLTGVATAHQGKGINRLLLLKAKAWAHSNGLDELTISTQISNLASQRSLIAAGFAPFQAFHTFHWWFEQRA